MLLLLLSCSIHWLLFSSHKYEIGCWHTQINNKTEQLSQILFLFYGILKMVYLITSRNKVQEPSKLKYVLLTFLYVMSTQNRNILKKCYTHYWHRNKCVYSTAIYFIICIKTLSQKGPNMGYIKFVCWRKYAHIRSHIITMNSPCLLFLWSLSTEKLQCHAWVDCTVWYIASEMMWHCRPVQDCTLLKTWCFVDCAL